MDGHAFLLLVYFLPLTMQDHGEDLQDNADDYSDDPSVRTKRGVAKGDPHELRQIKAATNLTFFQLVGTTMSPGLIVIRRHGCALRLCS